MINAIQRHAAVIVQKSLAEGFGLTVAEGMWKGRPVLGSAVGMAIIQFWPEWQRVVTVAALFLGGNFVADYVVTPRLVGDRIGVHPLWVLFGVFAGGALFGFVGVLIAVPACALIGVLARFAITQYEASTYYRGIGDDAL